MNQSAHMMISLMLPLVALAQNVSFDLNAQMCRYEETSYPQYLCAQIPSEESQQGKQSRIPGFSAAGSAVGFSGAGAVFILGIVASAQYDPVKDDHGTSDTHDDTWNYKQSALVLPFVVNGIHLVTSHTAFWGGKSTRKRAGVRGLPPLRGLGALFGIVCAAELTVQPIIAATGGRVRSTHIVLGTVSGLVSNVAFAVDDLVIRAMASKKASAPSSQAPSAPRLSLIPFASPWHGGAKVGVAATF